MKFDGTLFLVEYSFILQYEIYYVREDHICLIWSDGKDYKHPMLTKRQIDSMFNRLCNIDANGIWRPTSKSSIVKMEVLNPEIYLTHESEALRKAAKYCVEKKNGN